MTKTELENKYVLARRAYKHGHFSESYSYYKEILNEAPNDYEAAFRLIISRVHTSTLSESEEIYHSLTGEVANIFTFETFERLDDHEKIKVVTDMEMEFTSAIIIWDQAVTNHYLEFQSLPNAITEFRSQMLKISSAFGIFGECIYNHFTNDEIKKICVNPLKNAVTALKKSAAGFPDDVFNSGASRMTLDNYTCKIRQFEKDYVNPCYVNKNNTGTNETNKTVNSKKDTSGRTFLFCAAAVSGIIALIAFSSGTTGGIGIGVAAILMSIIAVIMAPFFVS